MDDFNSSKRPGPATYTPIIQPKYPKGSAKQDAIRMDDRKYETFSPGPGSYRFQSEFGIYSPEDVKNEVEAHQVHQAVAKNTLKSPKKVLLSSNKADYKSKRKLNSRLPLSSSAGFSAV